MQRVVLVALLPYVAGCGKVTGVQPVAGRSSTLQQERFVRRLYLDLTGARPTEAQLIAGEARLVDDESATSRGALAAEVLHLPAFASNYVGELLNRVLAGEEPRARYDLICASYRNFIPECQACPAPDPTKSLCADCACEELAQLHAEERLLSGSADALTAGEATSAIERRIASSYMLQSSYGDGPALADALFRGFLSRTPSDDERRNAAQMAVAQTVGHKGVLFHRYGDDFGDLVDILFASEAYREAIVEAAFVRYLGRPPTAVERAHFVARLDAEKPDARPVIQAVVSSREYFTQ
jgi:hypothetical protein